MTSFTPGPWMAVKAAHGPIDILDSRGRDVVTVYGGGVETESQVPNSRLIAAAPDLLEALIAAKKVCDVAATMTSCRSDDDFVWSAQAKIDAAIAKAEGRS